MNDISRKAWYWYFVDAARLIPMRAWFWLAGIVLAIPTSYYGFVWLEYKLVKQQVNCYADLYENIAAATPSSSEAEAKQVLEELGNYNECNKAINPKVGTIEFVRKEYERGKSVGQ